MRETRELIEEEVRNNIGITFSDLKRKTGFANGVLQHHIRNSDSILQTKGAILPRAYCEEECDLKAECEQICIHKVLRDDVKSTILEGLREGKNQVEIAEGLGLHRSTVSYHIKRLRKAGLKE